MIATIGGALFVCNLCLLYCYVKRRAGKHICGKSHHHDWRVDISGSPQATSLNRILEEKSEIPFLIIASVSVGGVVLLIINIILLHCFIQRRKADNNAKDDVSLGMSWLIKY